MLRRQGHGWQIEFATVSFRFVLSERGGEASLPYPPSTVPLSGAYAERLPSGLLRNLQSANASSFKRGSPANGLAQERAPRETLSAFAHGGDQRQFPATGNPSSGLASQDRNASPTDCLAIEALGALFKSWVLNLLRVHGFDSMTEALDYMSNNLPLLLSFCH